jgi:hypothetical protein
MKTEKNTLYPRLTYTARLFGTALAVVVDFRNIRLRAAISMCEIMESDPAVGDTLLQVPAECGCSHPINLRQFSRGKVTMYGGTSNGEKTES